MRILILTLLLFVFISADAQTTTTTPQAWFLVAHEGDTVTATAIVRYGAAQGAVAVSGAPCATVGGCWSQLPVAGTIAVSNAVFGDPIGGTVKELDVLQTAVAQQITVNGKAMTVPAKGTNYSITCTALNVPNPPDTTVTYPASCKAAKQ